MSDKHLFREEVLQFVGHQHFGRTTIIQPISLRLLSLFILFICLIALAYLSTGEYARKETVHGFIEPSLGIVELHGKQLGGVVQEVFATPGQLVAIGDPLIRLETPAMVSEEKDFMLEVIETLQDQKSALNEQLKRDEAVFAAEAKRQIEVVAESIEELTRLHGFYALQIEQVKISQKQLDSTRRLRRKGAISETQWLTAESGHIEEQKEMLSVEQKIGELTAALNSAKHNVTKIPAQRADKSLQTELQISEIEQRINQISGQKDELLTAPIAGVVTAFQAKVGAKLNQNTPLLSIVPEDSTLEAVLLFPSAAMGFVEAGQTVRLMFDAYPHQQFGTHPAKLISLARAPVAAHELDAPIRVDAPVFVVRASLLKSTITAMGQDRLLQPGMLVKADIILERRSLLDWFLEPLYSLKGRTR